MSASIGTRSARCTASTPSAWNRAGSISNQICVISGSFRVSLGFQITYGSTNASAASRSAWPEAHVVTAVAAREEPKVCRLSLLEDWRKTDSKPQSLPEKSGRSEGRRIRFCVIGPAQGGTHPGGELKVRIHLPPAESPLRTQFGQRRLCR